MFCRNSCMTELKIEGLERNLAKNDSYKEEERSTDDTGNNLGEQVKDILAALEADEGLIILRKKKFSLLYK